MYTATAALVILGKHQHKVHQFDEWKGSQGMKIPGICIYNMYLYKLTVQKSTLYYKV